MSVRVHVLAKQLNLSSKELLAKLKELNVTVKGHMSVLDEQTIQLIQQALQPKTAKIKPKAAEIKQKTQEIKPKVKEKPAVVVLPEKKILKLKTPLTVKDLAVKLAVKSSELIKRMMDMKIMATINQMLNEETVCNVAVAYGFTLERLPTLEEELLQVHKEQPVQDKLCLRAPVVTFMGHVDHGKTSLLDTIRKTKVAAREAGGITQHIGAYEVKVGGKKITFLDTPGHEAFTAMRARGANATDIVVLVVAADDGVTPQTIEAIDHARAAGVPIVVAVNKCDLPNINVHKVKAQLSQHDLAAEDIGGKTVAVSVSAKTGEGIDNLLEMILLEAEMLELKANPDCDARGVVIESRLSRGTGPTATILVQNGTLSIGDMVICGGYCGRIKSMKNDRGEQQEKTGPSGAVEISGLS
ncbi:MAG: translation initiation factor IF-2, partial [Candidatus Omnitrophota bacterium]